MGLCKLVIMWWRHRVNVPSFERIYVLFLLLYIYILYKNIAKNKEIKYIFDYLNDFHQSCFVSMQLK